MNKVVAREIRIPGSDLTASNSTTPRKETLCLPTIDLARGPRSGRDPNVGPWYPPTQERCAAPDPAKAALVAAENRIKCRLQPLKNRALKCTNNNKATEAALKSKLLRHSLNHPGENYAILCAKDFLQLSLASTTNINNTIIGSVGLPPLASILQARCPVISLRNQSTITVSKCSLANPSTNSIIVRKHGLANPSSSTLVNKSITSTAQEENKSNYFFVHNHLNQDNQDCAKRLVGDTSRECTYPVYEGKRRRKKGRDSQGYPNIADKSTSSGVWSNKEWTQESSIHNKQERKNNSKESSAEPGVQGRTVFKAKQQHGFAYRKQEKENPSASGGNMDAPSDSTSNHVHRTPNMYHPNKHYASTSTYNLKTVADPDYDFDSENLQTSMTLPRIEAVLRAEGIKPQSISQQIDKIKERCKRQHKYHPPPKPKGRHRALKDSQPSITTTDEGSEQSVEQEETKDGLQARRKPEQDPLTCSVTSTRDAPANGTLRDRKQNAKQLRIRAGAGTPRDAAVDKLSLTPRTSRECNLHSSECSSTCHTPREDGDKSTIRTSRPSHVTYKKSPRDIRGSVVKAAQQDLCSFISDIENTTWMSNQMLEKGSVPHKFVQPRLVLVSSNIPRSTLLVSDVLHHKEHIFIIYYDFEKSTYESLLDDMRKKLYSYKEGCRTKSILIFCQGGPGYFYLLKRKVVTPQKLQKKDQEDLIGFWKDVGDMMSKVAPDEAFIHIMGCDVTAKRQGSQLSKELKRTMHPNIVHLFSPDEETDEGKAIVTLYMDYYKYIAWKEAGQKKDEDEDSEMEAIFAVEKHNQPLPQEPTPPLDGTTADVGLCGGEITGLQLCTRGHGADN